MNNEISEEAKQALADNARRKAFDRLEKDGAHSTAALGKFRNQGIRNDEQQFLILH